MNRVSTTDAHVNDWWISYEPLMNLVSTTDESHVNHWWIKCEPLMYRVWTTDESGMNHWWIRYEPLMNHMGATDESRVNHWWITCEPLMNHMWTNDESGYRLNRWTFDRHVCILTSQLHFEHESLFSIHIFFHDVLPRQARITVLEDEPKFAASFHIRKVDTQLQQPVCYGILRLSKPVVVECYHDSNGSIPNKIIRTSGDIREEFVPLLQGFVRFEEVIPSSQTVEWIQDKRVNSLPVRTFLSTAGAVEDDDVVKFDVAILLFLGGVWCVRANFNLALGWKIVKRSIRVECNNEKLIETQTVTEHKQS